MLKSAIKTQWVCSKCVKRQTQLRRLATASAKYQPGPAPVNSSAPGSQHEDRTLRQIFDSAPFWREFSQFSKSSYGGRNNGLVQNRYLTSPAGFEVFANNTVQKAKRLVEGILNANTVDEYMKVARNLDRLSDLLCRVIDLSDFIRAVHPDYRIQQAATNAYSMMFEYMNVLNTLPGLAAQLEMALNTPEVVASWTEEERVVAAILRKDFAKSAFQQPKIQRERFVTLSQAISEVGPDFVQNMSPAKPTLTFPESSQLRGMDPVLVKEHTRWGQVSIPSVGGLSMAAVRNVHNEEARREIFMASRTASKSTVEKLERMLKMRAELAKLSHYQTYAHLALEDKMAASPGSVNQFLQALSKDNQPKVALEKKELERAKLTDLTANPGRLQPWDKEYYMAKILASISSRTRNPDFLSDYLSLGTVMQGLSRLFTRLYGIRFVPRETSPGETWNSDVRRLDVISETEGHVAVMYCDLFSRPGKSPNPAHFTLRCSREIRGSELEEAAVYRNNIFSTIEEAANDGMAVSNHAGVLKQLPTIALICDFDLGAEGTSRPSLLSFHEVKTLFHEMGHAIHSILGRTTLQEVSGTRCATDFAELPSVLMEHFAADPSTLSLFARHYKTDQPLPYEMVAEKVALDNRFDGSDTEKQILLSMADQAYHSNLPFRGSFNTTEIFHEIQRTQGLYPPDPSETSWQGFFGHLFSYGSTYYSYLFDRVLARRIWQIVFKGGDMGKSLDRENGERMKEEVLRWGGGRDPWRCLAGVLRDERVEKGGSDAMAIVGSWGLRGEERC